jgi:hypothetical protein
MSNIGSSLPPIPYLIVFKDNTSCIFGPSCENMRDGDTHDYILVYAYDPEKDALLDREKFIVIPELDQTIDNLYEYLTSIINSEDKNVAK